MNEMEERLTISGPGLAGVLHVPDIPAHEAITGVVICHGMLSYKDSPKHVGIARELCERGHAVLRFDFTGRGDSPGDLMELSFSRQVAEARAAMAELRRRTGVARVGLTGSSMGGAVSILTSLIEKVAALVTMAAVGRTDLLAERIAGGKGMAVWERKGFLRLEEDPVGWSLVEDGRKIDVPAAAAGVDCPWLILHGELDDVVPLSDAEELNRAASGRAELEVVPGADHKFSRPDHLARVTMRAVDFLDAALRRPEETGP